MRRFNLNKGWLGGVIRTIWIMTGCIYGVILFVTNNCNAASYPRTTTTPLSVDLSMNQHGLTEVSYIYTNDIITKGPWVDVRAFGAVGNGIADDTNPITLAVQAAASAGGGCVYFPKGTYRLTNSIDVIGSSITLRGTGRATVLKQEGVDGSNNPYGTITLIGNNNIVEHMAIVNTGTAMRGRGEIKISAGSLYNEVHHVTIDVTSMTGIVVEETNANAHIHHNTILKTGEHGVYLSSASNCRVENNYFTGIGNGNPWGSFAIHVQEARGTGQTLSNTMINGNVFNGCAIILSTINAGTDFVDKVLIVNNEFRDNSQAISVSDDVFDLNIVGNRLDNATIVLNTTGVNRVKRVLVEGNIIKGGRVWLNKCDEVSIIGNRIQNIGTPLDVAALIHSNGNNSRLQIMGNFLGNTDSSTYGRYGIITSGDDTGVTISENTFGLFSSTTVYVEHNYPSDINIGRNYTPESLTIPSEAHLKLPFAGEVITVTGTANITDIFYTNQTDYRHRKVTLVFEGNLTVVDGNNLKLSGNFNTVPDSTLTLIKKDSVQYPDGAWIEVSRSSN